MVLSLSEPWRCHHAQRLLQTQGHSRGNRAGLMFGKAPMGALTQPIALLSVAWLPLTWVSATGAELLGSGGAGGSQALCCQSLLWHMVLLQPWGEPCLTQAPGSFAPSFPNSKAGSAQEPGLGKGCEASGSCCRCCCAPSL